MDNNTNYPANTAGAFSKLFTASEGDIDGFGHVNNAVYLRWIDDTVWAHTRALGLDERACASLNRGMVVSEHRLTYLQPVHARDEIAVFTWHTKNDGKLRVSRAFQLIKLKNQKTVMRATTDYICTNLTTGRPTRMPQEFVNAYSINCPSE